jgi:hypothetical protein
MKLTQITLAQIKRMQAFTPVLVVGVLMLTGAIIYNLNAHAATAGFTLSSGSSTYKVGDTFDVAVYEDSGSDCANVVEADVTYPANLLHYNSVNPSGSKFESTAPSNSGNGTVSIVQYTPRKECGNGSAATSGVSGNQLIANISFTVLDTGTAPLNFTNSTIAISSADNKTNVAPNSAGKSFTLTAVPVTPPPVNPPPVTPPPVVPPQPNPTPKPVSSTPVTSVTPIHTTTPTQLTDNDVVQTETPIDVNPFPIQPDGINRIEYYLNGKLVATVKTPPYTYHLDTTKMLNGSYKLTTKTYYANGQTKSTSQTVIVKNPFGWTQFKLRTQKFAWLIILLIILIGAAIAAWIIHKRGNGPDNYYGDSQSGGYDNLALDEGVVVSPSGPANGNGGYDHSASFEPLQQPAQSSTGPKLQQGNYTYEPSGTITPGSGAGQSPTGGTSGQPSSAQQPSNIIEPTQQPPLS